jgi:hypothetical protein
MPKLDLTKATIVPKSSEAKYRATHDVLENVKAELARMGLQEYPTPSSVPPSLLDIGDIDTLPNASLGNLYTQYVAYAQFIGARLAEAEARYKLSVNALKHLAAEMSAQMIAEEVPKGEVKDRVRDAPLYKELDCDLVTRAATKILLEAHKHAYDKQAAALSRVIALRELEFQQSLRQDNMKRKKPLRGIPTGDLR